MDWKLMGTLVPTLTIKLVGSSLFFLYSMYYIDFFYYQSSNFRK